jgi:hypothetical protein
MNQKEKILIYLKEKYPQGFYFKIPLILDFYYWIDKVNFCKEIEKIMIEELEIYWNGNKGIYKDNWIETTAREIIITPTGLSKSGYILGCAIEGYHNLVQINYLMTIEELRNIVKGDF